MTNRYLAERYSWIEATHGMRDELLAALTDADLAFTPGGTNHTFGQLLQEWCTVEDSYSDSLKSFDQTWEREAPAAELTALGAKFSALDAELGATVAAFDDEDLSKPVHRPGGFHLPVEMQLDAYLQAMLIYAGKASVYLKAMGRPLPPAIRDWIW